MNDPMLLVTDLDAFLFACGREDAAEMWVSEREERAVLHFWEALGERDLVAYCRGRLSLPGGLVCGEAVGVASGADQVTRTALVLQQHVLSSSRRKKLRLLESLEHTRPSSFFAPALITAGDGGPGSKTGGHVAPGRASGHDPSNALDDHTMFPGWTSCPGLRGLQRTQTLPALCRQFWQTNDHQRQRLI
jgi:hypothetical protein